MTNKEAIRVLQAIKEHPSMGVYLPDEYEALEIAIKALEEKPQGDCENCDYRKFTETFVDGVVEVMNKNGITSVEELEQIVRGEKNV